MDGREGAKNCSNSEISFEYSPESFTGTELEFALDVCNAVTKTWNPTPQNKIILNLPATVEIAMPNTYADQVEWMSRNLKKRNSITLSLHTHNDRGTGIAATELALLAGADRVEGTLFGNGERTGNCDIATMALNLFSQGIDPKLDFSDINRIANEYQYCTGLPIHPRHPYVGDLVYTAFSGSHQDAIAKGMKERETTNKTLWEVPYLPIDPQDVGRSYESIIRINSQSGKGGAAYIMDSVHGITLPKRMQPGFQRTIQSETERQGRELSPENVWNCFSTEYLEQTTPIKLLEIEHTRTDISQQQKPETTTIQFSIEFEGKQKKLSAIGTGALDAFTNGLIEVLDHPITILEYEEHALGKGADVAAIAFVKIKVGNHAPAYGAGINTNISTAAIRALISAYNRTLNRLGKSMR